MGGERKALDSGHDALHGGIPAVFTPRLRMTGKETPGAAGAKDVLADQGERAHEQPRSDRIRPPPAFSVRNPNPLFLALFMTAGREFAGSTNPGGGAGRRREDLRSCYPEAAGDARSIACG
ncbi:MAG: hypothetical protein JWO38_5400, partial [Gemmataceae bacterium]|nr:hypothetical protein [Gemmataceae bacterium]